MGSVFVTTVAQLTECILGVMWIGSVPLLVVDSEWLLCEESMLSKRLAQCFLQLHFRDGCYVTLRVMSGGVGGAVAVDRGAVV